MKKNVSGVIAHDYHVTFFEFAKVVPLSKQIGPIAGKSFKLLNEENVSVYWFKID